MKQEPTDSTPRVLVGIPGLRSGEDVKRDVFVHPSGEGPSTLQERRARAIVNAHCATTQRELADRGIAEVAVSRGMWFPRNQSLPDWVPAEKGQRGEAEVPLNAASSFTTRSDVASYFARREWDDDEYVSVRVHGTVPAARVLSTPRTGMGCLAEEEIVVLGGPGPMGGRACLNGAVDGRSPGSRICGAGTCGRLTDSSCSLSPTSRPPWVSIGKQRRAGFSRTSRCALYRMS